MQQFYILEIILSLPSLEKCNNVTMQQFYIL